MFDSRHQGVMTPVDQLVPETGEPNTVAHVVLAPMVAVQYFDEYGKAHNTVMLKVGNALYHAPNGEQWAGALRPAAPWLLEKVVAALTSAEMPIPVEDTVDVVATATAQQLGDESTEAP